MLCANAFAKLPAVISQFSEILYHCGHSVWHTIQSRTDENARRRSDDMTHTISRSTIEPNVQPHREWIHIVWCVPSIWRCGAHTFDVIIRHKDELCSRPERGCNIEWRKECRSDERSQLMFLLIRMQITVWHVIPIQYYYGQHLLPNDHKMFFCGGRDGCEREIACEYPIWLNQSHHTFRRCFIPNGWMCSQTFRRRRFCTLTRTQHSHKMLYIVDQMMAITLCVSYVPVRIYCYIDTHKIPHPSSYFYVDNIPHCCKAI